MKNLYRVLPAFAPDYSGISAALFEMDGLTIFYDAHGCNGQTLYYTEPRYQNFASLPKSFSFSISEREAILGADKFLIEKIRLALDWVKAPYIVVVGTPLPMLMGTDFPALEQAIERATGLPTVALPSNGLHFYDQGEGDLWQRLIEKFATEKEQQKGCHVNLIGATPLDEWDSVQINDYMDWLYACGATSVSCWGRTGDIEQIIHAASACLNIPVSYGGMQAAKLLQQKFGTPYLPGYPVGKEAMEEYAKAVQGYLQHKENPLRPWWEKPATKKGSRVLLLGDQINNLALARYLRGELGFDEIILASYFSQDAALTSPGEIALKSEEDLLQCFADKSYDLVVADPVYQPLIPDTVGRFCPLPHMATSGLLHWQEGVSLFGLKGSAYFEKLMV